VVNSGNLTATTGFTVSYYLSADPMLDSTDPLLAQSTTAPVTLRPGQGKGVSLRLGVPPGTAVGGYFLFAVLTPTNAAVNSVTSNDVAISDRRVAVVTRLPRPVVIQNFTEVYYEGPDYYYDETGGYGYYTDVAVRKRCGALESGITDSASSRSRRTGLLNVTSRQVLRGAFTAFQNKKSEDGRASASRRHSSFFAFATLQLHRLSNPVCMGMLTGGHETMQRSRRGEPRPA
jgi:hypothetical protein